MTSLKRKKPIEAWAVVFANPAQHALYYDKDSADKHAQFAQGTVVHLTEGTASTSAPDNAGIELFRLLAKPKIRDWLRQHALNDSMEAQLIQEAIAKAQREKKNGR